MSAASPASPAAASAPASAAAAAAPAAAAPAAAASVDTSGGNDGTKKIRELCHSVDDANEVLKECDMMKGYISSQLATALVTRFYLKRALDTVIAVRCVFPSIRPDELCTPCTCHMLTYVCLVFCRVQYAHKHKHAKGGRPTKEVTNQKLRLEKALEKCDRARPCA